MTTVTKTAVIVKSPYAKIEQVVKGYRSGVIEQKIVELRGANSKIMWDLGDLAMEILAACALSNVQITQFEAAAHVNWRMKGSYAERSPKTIEGYMATCVFFPSIEQNAEYKKNTGNHLERAGIRELYSALPFANFELAKRAGSRWEAVLKFAAQAADRNNGEPIAVSKVQNHFFPKAESAPLGIDDMQGDYRGDEDFADEVNERFFNSEAKTDSISALSSMFAGMKLLFGEVAKKYPDAKNEIAQVSDAIERLLQKLG